MHTLLGLSLEYDISPVTVSDLFNFPEALFSPHSHCSSHNIEELYNTK